MRRVLPPLLLVATLIGIAVAGWWLRHPADAIAVACADPLAGCRFSHRGTEALLRFSAAPAPMEAFRIEVQAPDTNRASAEFQMVGMDMGFNRYDLKRAGAEKLVAQVTLPVCVSGRRDWILYLELDGARYAIPFSTR